MRASSNAILPLASVHRRAGSAVTTVNPGPIAMAYACAGVRTTLLSPDLETKGASTLLQTNLHPRAHAV